MPYKNKRKRFCPQGHDTQIVGRTYANGCRKCASIRSMAWQSRNPENKREAMRRWYKKHGKAYRKQRPEAVKESRRKQEWRGVLNQNGQQFTSQDYEKALLAQKNRCGNFFCERKGKLHMDHDHKTMKFRGLLCGPCNRALGLCKDKASVLRGLAAYITFQEKNYEKTPVSETTSH